MLAWLIRNLEVSTEHLWDSSPTSARRRRLAQKDSDTINEALAAIERSTASRGWHILEGESYPDAFVETLEYLLVVEGKRTERKPTDSTTWLAGRRQIWRHIDAAYDVRQGRPVYGILIVEATDQERIPPLWLDATDQLIEKSVLERSLPHRSDPERHAMRQSFLGVTTWQRILTSFGLDWHDLPDTVSDVPAWRIRMGLDHPTTELSSA
jgi:hypothetical protein